MKKLKIGKAWIIYSANLSTKTNTLISILSPRKPIQTVAEYVQQIYIDRFASLEERIAYKKNKSTWPYPAETIKPAGIVSCGFDPIYWAYYCNSIHIDKNKLVGEYRYITKTDKNHLPLEFNEGEVIMNFTQDDS